jgi:hypothetical protein
MPRIISMAIRNMMNEPAMANEETSIPKMPSIGLPINRNARKITSDTIVTLTGLTSPDFDFMSSIIGMEPGMSIIAKRTMKDARISIKLIFIPEKFTAKVVRNKLTAFT